MNNWYRNLIVVAAMSISLSSAWAAETVAPESKKMDDMQDMDHSKMDHGSKAAPTPTDGKMEEGHSMSMQGGSAPPDARDPHAYSGGYDFGPYTLEMADRHMFGSIMLDRLESVITSDNTFTVYDLQARYGLDYDRVVLKSEGHIDNGKVEEASTELLWGHAIAAYWDSQLGVRYDTGLAPTRTWLALGVQGLAPYWFEIDATAYVGDEGRTALGVEAEYELLLTQKLILQPRVEAAAYGKRDPERGIGAGLSELSAGIRLRYEFTREFAPYIGVEWAQKYGETKDFARAEGEDPSESRLIAGIRFWY